MAERMTEAEISRAVRAGFARAGADPERYHALVGDIVADVAEALRAFAPGVAPQTPTEPAASAHPATAKRTDAA